MDTVYCKSFFALCRTTFVRVNSIYFVFHILFSWESCLFLTSDFTYVRRSLWTHHIELARLRTHKCVVIASIAYGMSVRAKISTIQFKMNSTSTGIMMVISENSSIPSLYWSSRWVTLWFGYSLEFEIDALPRVLIYHFRMLLHCELVAVHRLELALITTVDLLWSDEVIARLIDFVADEVWNSEWSV